MLVHLIFETSGFWPKFKTKFKVSKENRKKRNKTSPSLYFGRRPQIPPSLRPRTKPRPNIAFPSYSWAQVARSPIGGPAGSPRRMFPPPLSLWPISLSLSHCSAASPPIAEGWPSKHTRPMPAVRTLGTFPSHSWHDTWNPGLESFTVGACSSVVHSLLLPWDVVEQDTGQHRQSRFPRISFPSHQLNTYKASCISFTFCFLTSIIW